MAVQPRAPGGVETPEFRHLQLDRGEHGIVTVTFNRPDKKNAVGALMHTELSLVFRLLERDPDVRVIVLTGAGSAFSAGGDLEWMQEMIDDPAIFANTIREAKEIVLSMLDCEKPLIGKINGHAVGLGATLALFCDVTFASTKARIGDAHVCAGLVAADGGAIIWPQLIGPARAKEFLMTGDLMSAEEAVRIGLINHAVASEELDAAVDAFARRLAAGPQQAIRWTKTAVNLGLKQLAVPILDSALAFEAVTSASRDHQEAVAAFREARSPVFGR
jgi:enoyl-CoA hydratase